MLSRKAHAANIHLQMDIVQCISIKVIHLIGVFGNVGEKLTIQILSVSPIRECFPVSSKHLTVFKRLAEVKLVGDFTYYS